MPFPTTWPVYLREHFDLARRFDPTRHIRRDLYAPLYMELLRVCFRDFVGTCDFYTCPERSPHNRSPDHRSTIIIHNSELRPVLVAEIRDETWFKGANRRLVADHQMRQSLNNKFDARRFLEPLPRLWGLSLYGTSLRVYSGDSATRKIDPSPVDHPNRPLPMDLLESAWDIDILSQQGFNKMEEIVNDVVTQNDIALGRK